MEAPDPPRVMQMEVEGVYYDDGVHVVSADPAGTARRI